MQEAQTKILFFDTETSGFIKKDYDSKHPDQAWCIQIGALLTDETGHELEIFNQLIKPNGREINYHAEQIHGITAEHAEAHGISELSAIEKFGQMMRSSNLVVCHNFDFDIQYVTQMMERNIESLSAEARSAFYLDLHSFCTMKNKKVKSFIGAKNKLGKLKVPNLNELSKKLLNQEIADAHDAFADIMATKNCFFKLIEKEVIFLEDII